MLNRVVLVGRLTKDPELRYTPTGVAVANFTIAVERNFKNAQGEREADFIPIVVYRQAAEYVANYISKGKLVSVDGRLQIRTYTDNDGKKHWVTEVISENVYGLSPREREGSENASPATNTTSSFGHEVVLDDPPF